MGQFNVKLLILVVLFSLAWGQAAPEFGQIWHNYDQNPTCREYFIEDTWNEGAISFSTFGHAMWDGEQYRLYVSRRGPTGTLSIGLFITQNLDSAWVPNENNPIFEPSQTNWDSTHVATPMVLKDGDTYKMWYCAWDVPGDDWYFGYAESRDGVSWTRHPSPILGNDVNSDWDSYRRLAPYVLKENDTTYTMYYAGTQTNTNIDWVIGSAHSNDGVTWTHEPENPIVSHEGSWSNQWVHIPVVKKINGKYTMWFAGASRGANRAQIGTALSSDGIHWRKDHLYNPVQTQGQIGEWNDVGSYPLEVFEEHGVHKLYYSGIDESWDYFGYGYSEYNPTIIPAGEVSGTWTQAESPYLVAGEITIPNGETLTLEPGVTVEFLEHTPLLVQGQIVAEGTEDEPIRFMVDDTLGLSNLSGTDGVWGGIRFEETPATNDSSNISYAEIAYCKSFSGESEHTGSPVGDALTGTPGGGVYIEGTDKLTVDNSVIHHCFAIGDVMPSYALGAGITVCNHANPIIRNNIIEHNTARHLLRENFGVGAGMLIYESSNPRVVGNIIRHNRTSDAAGGIGIWKNSEPVLVSNLIHDNVAKSFDPQSSYGAGGGVGIGLHSSVTFINNTITNNTASLTGGGVYSHSGSAKFVNTIIANNTSLSDEQGRGYQLGVRDGTGETFKFIHSCIEDGTEKIAWEGEGHGRTTLINSITTDPYLRSNFTLNPFFSTCIGAGLRTCLVDGVNYCAPQCDVRGDPCPMPEASLPDMGVFESPLAAHALTPYWNPDAWASGPVYTPGVDNTWNDEKVWSPDVLYFNNKYHMWFAGDNGNESCIGYATSSDGVTWENFEDNPAFYGYSAAWYGTHIYDPKVVKVGDVLHMWFANDANKIGHATSPNGKQWSPTTAPVLSGQPGEWDENGVAPGDVIYDGSLFHMWYTGGLGSPGYGIGYATSEDGINWERVQVDPVFTPSDDGWGSSMFYATSVVYNGSQFIMWYSAKDLAHNYRIGRATSHNGVNWSDNTPSVPEIGYGEPGNWNDAGSFFASVLIQGGEYKMWLNGANAADPESWMIGHVIYTTDTDSQKPEIPQTFLLRQNYPNPFNPMTHIRYSLPENGDIRLVVYDVLGREVVELVNGHRSVGNHETTWYGLDRHGNQVSTGVYFARLEAGRNVDVIKMLYLK